MTPKASKQKRTDKTAKNSVCFLECMQSLLAILHKPLERIDHSHVRRAANTHTHAHVRKKKSQTRSSQRNTYAHAQPPKQQRLHLTAVDVPAAWSSSSCWSCSRTRPTTARVMSDMGSPALRASSRQCAFSRPSVMPWCIQANAKKRRCSGDTQLVSHEEEKKNSNLHTSQWFTHARARTPHAHICLHLTAR